MHSIMRLSQYLLVIEHYMELYYLLQLKKKFDELCLQMQPHTVRLDHHTLKLLKYWTWQFVVIRPVCSVLMIALQLLGLYTDWISWTFTIILNISVSMALYALVIFYHVFAKELAPHKPLAKFMCIKGIVFFCFWQVICFVDFFLGLSYANVVICQNFVIA